MSFGLKITDNTTLSRGDADIDGATIDAMKSQEQKAVKAVQRGWPVDSGRSSRGWSAETAKAGSSVSLRLFNTEDYAGHVRGGKALDDARQRVLTSVLDGMIEDIEDAIVEELGG